MYVISDNFHYISDLLVKETIVLDRPAINQTILRQIQNITKKGLTTFLLALKGGGPKFGKKKSLSFFYFPDGVGDNG